MLFLPFLCQGIDAQRRTDNLDRGLVGVKVNGGVFLSWRVQADEYYDVNYNLYRNGVLIAQNLYTSNYTDASGSTDNTYTVAPVRKGVVGTQCAAVKPWAQQYLEIPVSNVLARSGVTVWKQSDPSTAMADYQINDISLGDVDGDGKVDLIVKRKNLTDQYDLFPESNKQMFCQIECYASSINYGRLWWIDCGPNICYGADEQWDAVAFDWNEDGACEVLYRGGANTVIHHSDGTTETIGDVNENIRGGITHYANMTFSNAGEEWLMYIDGRTGRTYDVISYPLPRGKATDWGDGYGHRSSKYFMGAPYLDGVNPYIFLGRGIYTKIDACTYRVNKATNKLYKVGNTWHSYENSGWHGQGYHNFAIADADEDGSDEIIYGSMVLDFHTGDNSLHGCASTGLGHGDASHTGDLDPFRKGLETFACNEDDPAYNYRNAATCEIYARYTAGGDDGRSMAANITNEYPGCIGASTTSGIVPLSYVQPNPYAPTYIDGMANNWNGQTPYPMALNFRIYWDGDLLDETINGPGSNESYLYIDKLGARIFDTNYPQWTTACINGTKKNPCASGDILGDWREELIVRSSDNRFIRIYTTVVPTEHRMPSLWYDHQYRQSMVWQTEGYNQPPHTSFFVGELEGLTAAPPPFTWAGRTGIGNNGTISTSHNNKDVLIMPNGNGSEFNITMGANAQPSTVFLVSRTTIEGGDQVAYKETKHTFDRIRITGNAFSGTTNIAKQGDAAAHLPYAKHVHTGKTDVWMGALICNGSLVNSPLWANRHTEVYLGNALDAEASVYKSVEMEYGSKLLITNHSVSTPVPTNSGYAHMTVGDLTLKEGSRVVFDINGSNNAGGDKLDITGVVTTRKQNWKYGPKYLQPIFEFRASGKLANGDYELGSFGEFAKGSSFKNVIIEIPGGKEGSVAQLYGKESTGKYYLHIGNSEVIDEFVDLNDFSDRIVYLYNENQDKFLSRGSSWGTRSIADDFGIPVKIELGNNAYTLKSLDNDLYHQGDSWMYGDKTTANIYRIEQVEGKTGYYTLTNIGLASNNKLYIYTKPGADQYAVATNAIIGDNCTSAEDSYWRLISADERNEIIKNRYQNVSLAEAKKAGLDVETFDDIDTYGSKTDNTSKIVNNTLRVNADGWTQNQIRNAGNNAPWIAINNNVGEFFQSANSLSQTVTGLTNGLYKVSISGFFREGSSANCVKYAGYKMSTAYLQAGANKVQIKDWASERVTDTNPNSLTDAATLFDQGKYSNAVYTYVNNGTLTITIACPTYLAAGWLTFRDVKLERIHELSPVNSIAYLYNPETKKFLGRGGAWGTQGVADDFGVPVLLEESGDKIKMKSIDHDYYYGLAPDLYSDVASANAGQYTLVKVGDCYTISSDNGYVYVNGDKVSSNGSDGNAATAKWQLLTAAKRNARVAEFHNENAARVAGAAGLDVDTYAGLKQYVSTLRSDNVTNLLENGTLNGNTNGWTVGTFSSNLTNKAKGTSNFNAGAGERYNQTSKFTKTISKSNLPAGLYKFTVYGFYRQGSTAYADDINWKLSNAYLDVNGTRVQWADRSTGNKPSFAESAASFNAGNYENTVIVYLNGNEDMNITIAQPGWTSACWFTFYNASITYYDLNDVTSLITNASFDDGRNGWAGEPTVNDANKNAEFYNRTFDVYQILDDIPNGWYTIGVQGFYRHGLNPGTASKALLYANGASTYVRRIDTETVAACGLSTGKLPNTMTEAKQVFDKGLYHNELKVYVSDNTLRFGIKKETATTADWAMFDNFTLKYSKTNDDPERTQYIKDPSFETGDLLYWSCIDYAKSDTKSALNSDATYTMSNAHGNYVFNTWTQSGTEYGTSQNISGLPRGRYKLSAVFASDVSNKISMDLNYGYMTSTYQMSGNKGNGQKEQISEFVVRDEQDLLLNITSPTWFKIDDIRLTWLGDADDDVLVDDSKKYASRLVEITKTKKNELPVGDKMFDYDSNSEGLTAVKELIDRTETICASGSSTLELVDNLVKEIMEANATIGNDKSQFRYVGPKDGVRYNIMVDGTPITFTGTTDSPFMFNKNKDVNYTQSFILEKDDNVALSYRLCFLDENGNKQYLCTTGDADNVSGNDYSITTTTDPSAALTMTVERSADYATSDVVYLKNTKFDNNYLNRLSDTFKTGLVSDGKGNFVISVADKANPVFSVTTSAGWGTFIAPFAVDIPDNVQAYTVVGDEGEGVLVLEELAGKIPAHTPVVLRNASDMDVKVQESDYGTAMSDEYKVGYLIGRYSPKTVTVTDADEYAYFILQKQDAGTAFYRLLKDRNMTAYRCYLELPMSMATSARLRFPSDEELTGIGNVSFDDLPVVDEVSNASGIRVNKVQKGLNIVKFNDGTTRKLYIK